MSRLLTFGLLFSLIVAWPMGLSAAERSPARTNSIPQVVDEHVDRALAEAGVQAAPTADDANLIRRLTLDLAGRIPTTAEVQSFVTSQAADKRTQLIERLMASPEFDAHQINEFDTLLMYGTSGSLREYLTVAIREGRGWDRVYRDLITGHDQAGEVKGIDQFLKARVKDTDRLTNDVSVLFFGVNISCTQCHDHPLVDQWKQEHFYGLKSFFNRTFENGGFLAERDYGVVTYKTPKGEERTASLMFLTGEHLQEPAPVELTNEQKKTETKQLKEWATKKVAPPPPKFSRRAQLVDVALRSGENQYFARSIVNRLWYRLMGYGLVMPLDQLHDQNSPSHPELLDWLAHDLIDHGYDCRRTLRGLISSKTYARSSRWSDGDRPAPELFAVAQVRPMSPLQLSASLWIATADPRDLAATEKESSRRIESLVNRSRGMASLFDMPQESFQIGTTEPLWFSNGGQITNELLADGGNRLVARLKSFSSLEEQINAAYWSVLSRAPTAEESQLLVGYLKKRQDRPVAGLQQMVWALVGQRRVSLQLLSDHRPGAPIMAKPGARSTHLPVLSGLNRRGFLAGAMAGTAALAADMTAMNILAEPALAKELRRQDRRVILFWLAGGASQLETWDPKPGRPTGGPFRAIPTSVPGIHISELMPKMAQRMQHTAIVRSLNTKNADHGGGAQLMQLGRRDEPSVRYPDMGAVVARELGRLDSQVPDYVSFYSSTEGRGSATRQAGFLGARYAPMFLTAGTSPEYLRRLESISDADHRDRAELQARLAQQFTSDRTSPALGSHAQAYSRVRGLMASEKLFDIEQEPQVMRDRYGPTLFGQQTLAARRLIEAGVPFVKVGRAWWDSHGENFETHLELVTELDHVMSTLIDDLKSRGLLEQTLIVTLSEFGALRRSIKVWVATILPAPGALLNRRRHSRGQRVWQDR